MPAPFFCLLYLATYILSVASVEEIITLEVQQKVYAAVLSSSRQVIWSTSSDNISSWTLPAGAASQTLRGHAGSVLALALSTDGAQLLSAGADNTVKLWDAEKGTALQTFTGHSDAVWAVAFISGPLVASGSADGTVKLWNATSGAEVLTLDHPGGVRALAVSPTKDVLVSGGMDNVARVWSVISGKLQFALNGHTAAVDAVAVSPDGQWIATGGEDGALLLWSPGNGTLRQSLNLSHAVTALAFSNDSQHIASGHQDTMIRVWSVATEISQAPQLELRGHNATVSSVSYSADGLKLLSSSLDGSVRLWHTTVVNCEVSAWSDWGVCLGGLQIQTCTVVVEPANGGAACPHLLQSQQCVELTTGKVVAIVVCSFVGAVFIALTVYFLRHRCCCRSPTPQGDAPASTAKGGASTEASQPRKYLEEPQRSLELRSSSAWPQDVRMDVQAVKYHQSISTGDNDTMSEEMSTDQPMGIGEPPRSEHHRCAPLQQTPMSNDPPDGARSQNTSLAQLMEDLEFPLESTEAIPIPIAIPILTSRQLKEQKEQGNAVVGGEARRRSSLCQVMPAPGFVDEEGADCTKEAVVVPRLKQVEKDTAHTPTVDCPRPRWSSVVLPVSAPFDEDDPSEMPIRPMEAANARRASSPITGMSEKPMARPHHLPPLSPRLRRLSNVA
eukprot:GGOE01005723.1.p1 GENE.GGOE01005723.1~~GGOE01005723.1.p1  ORF type:complete len:679 (-),score=140.30 GGOE01005723.1:1451-3463(-)